MDPAVPAPRFPHPGPPPLPAGLTRRALLMGAIGAALLAACGGDSAEDGSLPAVS